jgi:hypothetical protein
MRIQEEEAIHSPKSEQVYHQELWKQRHKVKHWLCKIP